MCGLKQVSMIWLVPLQCVHLRFAFLELADFFIAMATPSFCVPLSMASWRVASMQTFAYIVCILGSGMVARIQPRTPSKCESNPAKKMYTR